VDAPMLAVLLSFILLPLELSRNRGLSSGNHFFRCQELLSADAVKTLQSEAFRCTGREK